MYNDIFRFWKELTVSSNLLYMHYIVLVAPLPPLRPEKLVWHGSSTAGIRLTTNYCEAWRTADVAVTGQAALLQTGRLLGQHTRSCSNHYIALCIENTFVGGRS